MSDFRARDKLSDSLTVISGTENTCLKIVKMDLNSFITS